MMIDPDWSSTILSKVEIKEDLPAPVLPTIPTWGGSRIFSSKKNCIFGTPHNSHLGRVLNI